MPTHWCHFDTNSPYDNDDNGCQVIFPTALPKFHQCVLFQQPNYQPIQVLNFPTAPTAPPARCTARAGEEDLALRGRLQPWWGPRGGRRGAAAGAAGVVGWLLHRGQGAGSGTETRLDRGFSGFSFRSCQIIPDNYFEVIFRSFQILRVRLLSNSLQQVATFLTPWFLLEPFNIFQYDCVNGISKLKQIEFDLLKVVLQSRMS